MAIIARVASHTITPAMDIAVLIQYFDDNDPANSGVGQGQEPGVVLDIETLTHPPTLAGAQLQAALAAEILAHGTAFVRARNTLLDARSTVPVGSLENVEQ